jgi:triosephosphate isomerase
MIVPLIAGNWKMNGLTSGLDTIAAIAAGVPEADKVRTMICPPATLIAASASAASGTALQIGGQDCHTGVSGAHTGDVSAEMLRDAGASAVIIGHSERRSDHGETDALVAAKVGAALAAGLDAIVCVGETAGQRAAGLAEAVVLRQLRNSIADGADPARIVVAYEPVWAIGTGLVATPVDVDAIHTAMRTALVERFAEAGDAIALLYGGSVKPGNAAELLALANVNGALVGGASLKSEDFLGIVEAA